MKATRIARSIALASALAGAATGALAANQGSLGTSSTGDLGVTLAIADRVQISGLDDIPLGTYGGSGDLTGESLFCVYRNGTGLYDLEASSANADGTTFRASDGTNQIAYAVKVDADTDASDGIPVASGEPETGLQGHDSATDCGGSDNASLQVSFAEADLQAAPTSSYNDTITVLVTPH
jgi:spore coat protein U-like protein